MVQIRNQVRILSVLERRGIQTSDIKQLLANPKLQEDIKDAATLQNLGEDVLNRQSSEANRAAARGAVLPTVKTLGLGTFGYELLKRLIPQGGK